MSKLSLIVPVLNEESNLVKQRTTFNNLIKIGHEIIVVDGGSEDKSLEIAKDIGCVCLQTKSSRGFQLQAGAEKCSNEVLVFLHADTQLPTNFVTNIQQSLINTNKHWGRFNVTFTNPSLAFKIVALFMNTRTCLTSVVTGDHVIYVRRDTYFELGGFADIPLMEDIEFSKRLRKHSRSVCLKDRVITSSRKWEKNGILKTIISMWQFRLLYFFGASPSSLAKRYYK